MLLSWVQYCSPQTFRSEGGAGLRRAEFSSVRVELGHCREANPFQSWLLNIPSTVFHSGPDPLQYLCFWCPHIPQTGNQYRVNIFLISCVIKCWCWQSDPSVCFVFVNCLPVTDLNARMCTYSVILQSCSWTSVLELHTLNINFPALVINISADKAACP